jgi:predicted phage tail protein
MTHWFAGCGMLVAGGLCRCMLLDRGASCVAGKVHQLLRVPPSGSSASKDFLDPDPGDSDFSAVMGSKAAVFGL